MQLSLIFSIATTFIPLPVVMMGGFHFLMDLLGAIGKLMEGSGLREMLTTIYGENVVQHMLSGKAVNKAFRGHLLMEKCLNMLLLNMLEEEDNLTDSITELENIYTKIEKRESNITDIPERCDVEGPLNELKTTLESESRTSRVFLNYMNMIKIAQNLVAADRSGNWNLLQKSIQDSLPILSASGNFHYLRSAHFFVEEMMKLPVEHPELHQRFQNGFHVIRRTDKFWAGLNSDLTIEQTLMRCLKTSGGLTRGSGMTEAQRNLWTESMPHRAAINLAMQETTGVDLVTSVQHETLRTARLQRDCDDVSRLLEVVKEYSPFSADSSLRNVVTGEVASREVNVDSYQSIGKEIIKESYAWKERIFA